MIEESLRPQLLASLVKGRNLLHLSVEAPERVPGWDAVALTAASDAQARLYERQLARARARRMLPERTRLVVVPDPDQRRIGSGGATFNALRVLAREFPEHGLARRRILLIHAGGDSKRLPWSNVFGKPFLPFPLLADEDHAVPTLFDLLLALAAPMALRLRSGGLATLTGDVLPLFDSENLPLPEHGALVVTTPAPLDVAGRHGVIVPGAGNAVARLLQKPTPAQLKESGALVYGGAALIDTGVYVFAGGALDRLAAFARAEPDPVEWLAQSRKEWSLYEEVASAFVPAHHAKLRADPWGARLVEAVGPQRLTHHRSDTLAFLHFGTTAEQLEHLGRHWYGRLPSRLLAECGPAMTASSFCYASALEESARVGGGALVVESRLGRDIQVGNRCVVVNVEVTDDTLRLPDNHCLWQLPVQAPAIKGARVTVCCGVDDNPKNALSEATFCNRRFSDWMTAHGVASGDLWAPGEAETLWTARLFPVHSARAGLHLIRWMLSAGGTNSTWPERWRASERVSLASLHARVDVERLMEEQDERRAGLLLRALRHAVEGRLDRNIHALAEQLGSPELRTRAWALEEAIPERNASGDLVPASRRLQIRADLLRAAGQPDEAARFEARAFESVQREVSAAVAGVTATPVHGLKAGASARVDLPVRFDISGGWSDTPPYSLERPTGVLNFALTLNGERPVGAIAEALEEKVWDLTLADGGRSVRIPDSPKAAFSDGLSDPFHLLRTALRLAGYGSEAGISQGVRITSWARVPRGSGLGTSSILGAAIVRALQRLAGRPDDSATVSDMVLALEQMMTTGGGWQDQAGGLMPGLKFISSVPVTPMRLHVEPVYLLPEVLAEFRSRFVLAFSGQDRLAKNVLQIVVGRYLRRDRRLIEAIESLVGLARDARRSLAVGNLDEVGAVLREVWRLHQQLDPHCSNPFVDAVFADVDDLAAGYKLAGAGGGGFMGILAKDAAAAARIRERLAAFGQGVAAYEWDMAEEAPG